MGVITENGWPQCSRAECETLLVPGTEGDNPVRIELRAGDVATVLTAWTSWFHRNVMPINTYRVNGRPARDWWGWSATNDVWNSNHLSATGCDLCATQLPWQRLTMSPDRVAIVERGLVLFEGLVFWGRHWDRVDEMHFQINGGLYNNPKLHEFAERLRNGYLNIFGPPDPLAFPLPAGYYFGPLDGPIESISGEYQSDSQYAKDGLGRWQAALGIPVTKKWDDGITPKAATTLQLAKGWPPNPLFGYGGVYLGEWDAVMREGWRLPAGWSASDVPEPENPVTLWGDYSQYQAAFVTDAYPYPVISFRASVADATRNDSGSPTGKAGVDVKFFENMRRARQLVSQGKLKKVIAYHFFVPGADNWGTFKAALDGAGGVFPELALMIDVEDGGSKWNIRGDQSVEVNNLVLKAQEYLQNAQGVLGYINFRANNDLWLNIPQGLKLIVPDYRPGVETPYYRPGVTYFAHQFSSTYDTPPFGPTDINRAKLPLSQFLLALGKNGGTTTPEEPEEPSGDYELSEADMIRAYQVIMGQFDA